MNDDKRNLTDADVEAIVSELKAQLVTDFYGEVGRGVFGWVKKGFWMLLLILAVYGMANNGSLLAHFQPEQRQ